MKSNYVELLNSFCLAKLLVHIYLLNVRRGWVFIIGWSLKW